MHLNDWNAYRRQLVAAVGDFAKLSPDTVKGYVTLGSAGQKVGRLGNKTRELIALAAAISLRCDGCIAVHAAAAREHGATKEEISEALAVAVGIRGGGSRLLNPRVGCVRRRRRSLTPLWKELPMLAYFRLLLTWIAHSDRVGITAMRIAIAIVFLWIGALKFVPYEADSITPFVANSPVMSFFYKHPTEYKAHLTREGELNPADRGWQTANDTYAFSHGLGTVEVAIGLLTLVGLVSRRWGLLGATLAFLTPFVTLSFLVTTPEAWVPALGDAQHGFPYLSGAGRLVLKDVLLLAGAWLVMADSARALLATWVSAAPSRGRTESRLQCAALPINAEGRRNDAVPRPIYEYIP